MKRTTPARQAPSSRPRAGRGTRTVAPALRLSISAETGGEHAAFCRRNLKAAHAFLKPALRELSLVLVKDAAMAALHERYLGIGAPTDVLSFELDHDRRGQVSAGEVVVCVDEARRQSRKRNVELRLELLLYALHGMLHLCGFDDRTDRGFRTMHRLEDDILIRLGFGPVFAVKPKVSTRIPRRGRTGGRGGQ